MKAYLQFLLPWTTLIITLALPAFCFWKYRGVRIVAMLSVMAADIWILWILLKENRRVFAPLLLANDGINSWISDSGILTWKTIALYVTIFLFITVRTFFSWKLYDAGLYKKAGICMTWILIVIISWSFNGWLWGKAFPEWYFHRSPEEISGERWYDPNRSFIEDFFWTGRPNEIYKNMLGTGR